MHNLRNLRNLRIYVCGGHRTAWGTWFCPSTMWLFGMSLRAGQRCLHSARFLASPVGTLWLQLASKQQVSFAVYLPSCGFAHCWRKEKAPLIFIPVFLFLSALNKPTWGHGVSPHSVLLPQTLSGRRAVPREGCKAAILQAGILQR